MEEWIEIEGRNRQDAIERACNALNTNPNHLKFELLEDGNKYKIRARKLESDEVSQETREGDVEDAQPMDASEEDRPRSPRRRESAPKEEVDLEQPTEEGLKVKEILVEVVKFIDDTAVVEIKETDQTIYLDIQGDNAGLMIGKHGQTLQSLQYLVSRMSGLDRDEGKRIILDSEQYRARRQDSLEAMADRLAAKAKRSGRPVSAEPMGAADRRVIHMALADHPDVTTKSVGEGMSRRVMIVPREGRRNNSRRGGGHRSQGGGMREARGRRRSGPPPRKHDSFDAPPEPEGDFFEEDPDAPVMDEDFSGDEASFDQDE